MKHEIRDIGLVHFIGIGGAGMSGIAEVMHAQGYSVQGSDLVKSPNTSRLAGLGIPIMTGHDARNIAKSARIVVSSAIKPDNAELVAARAAHIPVIRRADMLGELMRFKTSIAVAGTHGKTTTTSLIAAILDTAGLDPTVINGGLVNAYGSHARLGAGEYMVVEADESDGSFVHLPADIAVVTNIDPEHMEYYGTTGALVAAFRHFIENIPFDGFAVMCMDHPRVQTLMTQIEDKRIISYGQNPQADIAVLSSVSDATGTKASVRARDRVLEPLHVAMPGKHNMFNALAAIAVAQEIGIADDVIAQALSSFGGVERRFSRTGVWNDVAIYDDYAHHPVEIAAVLETARLMTTKRVIAVVQPHRFTRLRDLFEDFHTCFNNADSVLVAPVYAAGETPIEGATHEDLVDGLRRAGHGDAVPIAGSEALAEAVAERATAGDVVVCMGAGSITAWARALPHALAEREKSPKSEESGECA